METKAAAPQKKHVLIVDDNLDLATTYKELLEAHGYEASTAPNGVLALKHILHKPVDAIVCDLKMPQLEGDMFYSTVGRVQPQLAKRFVFITGVADDPKFKSFIQAVNAAVLRKPVAIEKLLAEIARVVN